MADAKQRVDFLLQQVETLKAKAGEVAAAASPSEHASRVAELHALAKRWDASATALPDVVRNKRIVFLFLALVATHAPAPGRLSVCRR